MGCTSSRSVQTHDKVYWIQDKGKGKSSRSARQRIEEALGGHEDMSVTVGSHSSASFTSNNSLGASSVSSFSLSMSSFTSQTSDEGDDEGRPRSTNDGRRTESLERIMDNALNGFGNARLDFEKASLAEVKRRALVVKYERTRRRARKQIAEEPEWDYLSSSLYDTSGSSD